jgi:hypothetical protein
MMMKNQNKYFHLHHIPTEEKYEQTKQKLANQHDLIVHFLLFTDLLPLMQEY